MQKTIIAALLLGGCASIDPGEIAVTHRFGQVSPEVKQSGIYFSGLQSFIV